MRKNIIFCIMMVLLIISATSVLAAEKKVQSAEVWDKFVQLFSNPLFFCRGECNDFRVYISSKKEGIQERILARYDLGKDEDREVYENYWAGKTMENPFRKKQPFSIQIERVEVRKDGIGYVLSEEHFCDQNFDGTVDTYRKYAEGYVPVEINVKTLPSDVRKQLQTRYDATLKRLTEEMDKQLREYLGVGKN